MFSFTKMHANTFRNENFRFSLTVTENISKTRFKMKTNKKVKVLSKKTNDN